MVPILGVKIQYGGGFDDCGRGDKDVGATGLGDLFKSRFHRGTVADVGCNRGGLTKRTDAGVGFVEALSGKVQQEDVSAFTGKIACADFADATGRAGDNYNAVFELGHVGLLSLSQHFVG